MKLANRTSVIQKSLTLAITAKAKTLKAQGKSVIGFGAGEPDFNTPDYIIQGAVDAMNKGMTKYTPTAGTLSLREAICQKFRNDNGLDYEPNNIIVSNGAKQSLYNAMLAIVDEGDEVIIPSPYWLTYPELVKLCKGKCVFVQTQASNGFKMTPEELSNAISDRTRAVIINSPCNPTGSVYSEDELKALAEVIEKHEDLFIIADEIYEKLIYDGNKHYSIANYSPKIKERTIVINGMSKTYSMTGWRIGYLAADSRITSAIEGIQSHTTSNPNSIAQYASQVALQGGGEFLNTLVTTFDRRRKLMVEMLSKIQGIDIIVPQGAFYVMVNVSSCLNKKCNDFVIKSAHDFATAILDAKCVALVPGEAFGAPNFVRLSYALAEDDIKEGITRLGDFISSLQ